MADTSDPAPVEPAQRRVDLARAGDPQRLAADAAGRCPVTGEVAVGRALLAAGADPDAEGPRHSRVTAR